MPGQDFFYEKDNLVYFLDKVFTQIIVTIFRENLIDKKNDQDTDPSSTIQEIKGIKVKTLHGEDVLIVLDSLDKCSSKEGNEFIIQCCDKIFKLENPIYTLNALHAFFRLKLHTLFKSSSLSKENFINSILQHKYPEKIVNIIYIINKHQLFCAEEVKRILSLNPQDLNSFEESLIRTHNEISKKNKDNIIFDCLGNRSNKLLSNEEKYRLYKRNYVSACIDDFFKERDRDREIDKSYTKNKDQQEISIHPSSSASESLVKNKTDFNSEPKFIYVKKIYLILIDIIGKMKKIFRNVVGYNKNKKMLVQYQDCIKKLEKEKDITRFAHILFEVDMLDQKNPGLLKRERLNSIINKFIDERNGCEQKANILRWLNTSAYYESKPDQKSFIQKYIDKLLNDRSLEAVSSLESTQDLDSEHNDRSDISEKNCLNDRSLEAASSLESTQDSDSEHNDRSDISEKNCLNDRSLEAASSLESTQDLDSEHNPKVGFAEKNQSNKAASEGRFFRARTFHANDFEKFENNPEGSAPPFSIL